MLVIVTSIGSEQEVQVKWIETECFPSIACGISVGVGCATIVSVGVGCAVTVLVGDKEAPEDVTLVREPEGGSEFDLDDAYDAYPKIPANSIQAAMIIDHFFICPAPAACLANSIPAIIP